MIKILGKRPKYLVNDLARFLKQGNPLRGLVACLLKDEVSQKAGKTLSIYKYGVDYTILFIII